MKLSIRSAVKKITALLLFWSLVFALCGDIYALDGKNSALSAEQTAVERMRVGFENFDEVIDLSDLNIYPDDLTRLFSNATKNSPYLFYVDRRLSYTYRTGGCVIAVKPKYNMIQDEARLAADYCKSEVKRIAELARYGESELERALVAHDLICRRFKYDVTLESNNMYSFLKEKKGTCQGYAFTYMAVLRELGIECEYAASDSIVHIWLMVRIDGEWYHSDVTWDDPVAEDAEMSADRRHFLFSDKRAEADGYTDRYSESERECRSEKYDKYDFSLVLSPRHKDGDATHDGNIDLIDLISMRQGMVKCPICSDISNDNIINEEDIALQREFLLTNPVG